MIPSRQVVDGGYVHHGSLAELIRTSGNHGLVLAVWLDQLSPFVVSEASTLKPWQRSASGRFRCEGMKR